MQHLPVGTNILRPGRRMPRPILVNSYLLALVASDKDGKRTLEWHQN